MNFIHLGRSLFGKEVKFPINNKISIIIGKNGTGKTKLLELLFDYYKEKNEEVLYFPEYRKFEFTKEDVLNVKTMLDMMNNNIFKEYDITEKNIEMIIKFLPNKGEFISSGKAQIINFICKIVLSKNPIVMIDFPETNLDISSRETLIDNLLSLNIKKLIVVTHDPVIVSDYENCIVQIEDCF